MVRGRKRYFSKTRTRCLCDADLKHGYQNLQVLLINAFGVDAVGPIVWGGMAGTFRTTSLITQAAACRANDMLPA